MKLTKDIWIDEGEVQFFGKISRIRDNTYESIPCIIVILNNGVKETINFNNSKARDKAYNTFINQKDNT